MFTLAFGVKPPIINIANFWFSNGDPVLGSIFEIVLIVIYYVKFYRETTNHNIQFQLNSIGN